MTNEELQSQTISFLRFPLIVGVVMIHSYFSEVVINGVDLVKNGFFPIYSTVSFLFSQIVSRVAVPLFFFISGFLFFFKINSFTSHVYLQKLKKKSTDYTYPLHLLEFIGYSLLFYVTDLSAWIDVRKKHVDCRLFYF